MTDRVDLYGTYNHFTDRVLAEIRKETFGVDIGQNSWVTADEYERWIPWLNLSSGKRILEVASGSGGPALYLARATGCHVTGIDSNEHAVATAREMAARASETERVRFEVADADSSLPFEEGSFDALVCIDAMNHFPNRPGVLGEWRRVLRNGARALFTDPVVITGAVTNEELALRSSIGIFLFVPPGLNDRLIEQAGFRLVRQEDVSDNATRIAGNWHDARDSHREDLLRIEGEERFVGLQRFFDTVRSLTRERRLSRIAYVAEKAP